MTPPRAEEVANSCLPGCYDPTGRECTADYRCEIHFRVAEALTAFAAKEREETLEEAAKLIEKEHKNCTPPMCEIANKVRALKGQK